MALDYNDIDRLLQKYNRHLDDMARSYGERGYDDPKAGILFANWNDVPSHITAGLERRGYVLEWSDEWTVASETMKAYRTSPTHYGWQPYFWQTEGGDVIGGDEIESDSNIQADYVEYLTNNADACNLFDIDFTQHGFVKLDETFETGFHPGQNDDPKKVLPRFQAEYNVIFDARGGAGQFDLAWSVWLKKKEIEADE